MEQDGEGVEVGRALVIQQGREATRIRIAAVVSCSALLQSFRLTNRRCTFIIGDRHFFAENQPLPEV